MSDLNDLERQIIEKGEEIRLLKVNKADKATLQPHVTELLNLKERFYFYFFCFQSFNFFFDFIFVNSSPSQFV